ncbi:dihydroxyacetone kinase subunit DhaK [Companilactobacillus alimentarius]|uniref:Dihydroxyacetone kinase subunit DhaK n=1 Tax=Companilactobacillus alimentarius DSM 20249 TaxID=1423720 RepID=A0A2K9HH87_9LACO|nr:dihydroxyacetone kinase subunit DhaK [Companilactobacillus alimentarius]AUI71057.1 dihydroxyacetone kinase subunit DhaK [Companilactobacillus alimentarius DSM 20249]KRK75174.1 dihydroxyacetone kinase subunit DhaK [Companilactobacillus alimentarius DSM 20249]MDT6951688.1 dihydroxyacetone kinase subunit DhaK [Companilactobacillus alimentarius]GEO44050.1 dihydroxyacetone kinase subunit DhaK [Companilactobacillus alimentarius]
MKKIINKTEDIVPEMISGLVKTNPDLVKEIEGTTAVVRNDEKFAEQKQVGVVSGGGSGHEPLHAGYVGDGMLSAAVAGEVFTSPTPDQIYEAIKAVDQGQGVLLIVKNYSGDVMNFDMAKEMAEADDIEIKTIVVDDDISVENSEFTQGKRGVAGTVLVEKIVGAAARSGMNLTDLAKLGQNVIDQTKTIGIALHAATVPAVGHPGFELAKDEIEYGIGIHNERGYAVEKIKPSNQLANELIEKIMNEFTDKSGSFAVLVNGMGGTLLMEQYIFANDVLNELNDKKIDVKFSKVGNQVTSLDMQGVSLTIMKADDSWIKMLKEPVTTIGW